MSLTISIAYTGGVPGGRAYPMRTYHGHRRESLVDVEGLWREEFRPRHFTERGARLYDYTPRSGEGRSGKAFWRSYTGRKKKYLGHRRPLVFTGKTEQLSRRRKHRVSSRGTKAALKIIIAAAGLNRRNPHSKINMREEMERVAPSEIRAMAARYERRLIGRINSHTGKKTVTIK